MSDHQYQERLQRAARIDFVAQELLRRGQIVIPHSVRMLYREIFSCTPQWGPSIYSDALKLMGWTYISRRVGYLREGVDYVPR